MLKMSAPNSNLFGAHLAQICAPNKPEPLKGNHFAQKRAEWARYFAHKWRSSLFRAGSGERSARANQIQFNTITALIHSAQRDDHMTDTTHDKIMNIIAIEAERAYRRGFQQGKTLGPNCDDTAIAKWRFKTSLADAVCPDTGRAIACCKTPRDRLEIESPNIAARVDQCINHILSRR